MTLGAGTEKLASGRITREEADAKYEEIKKQMGKRRDKGREDKE